MPNNDGGQRFAARLILIVEAAKVGTVKIEYAEKPG
jgi:hypothetical protein